MEYLIRRSARAKRMRLSLNQSGELTLVLPRFVPETIGRVFVNSQSAWIKMQQAKIKSKVEIYQQQEWSTGSDIIIFDQKKYSIKLISHSLKRDCYKINEKVLGVCLSPDDKNSKQKRIKILIESFYKDLAKEHLTKRSEYWAEQLGARFNQVRIKSTKSRWGSCSTKKNLNYNWKVLQAPAAVIDYLVIHEVCHLKEMNHSTKFWKLVENLDPKFKAHRAYLKEHQGRLLGFLQ